MLKEEQVTEGWNQGHKKEVVGGVSSCSNLETKKKYLILSIDIVNRCPLLSFVYSMGGKTIQGNINLIFGVWLILPIRQATLSPMATFGSPVVARINQDQGRESLFQIFATRKCNLKTVSGADRRVQRWLYKFQILIYFQINVSPNV